jgi:hypothetical protein
MEKSEAQAIWIGLENVLKDHLEAARPKLKPFEIEDILEDTRMKMQGLYYSGDMAKDPDGVTYKLFRKVVAGRGYVEGFKPLRRYP